MIAKTKEQYARCVKKRSISMLMKHDGYDTDTGKFYRNPTGPRINLTIQKPVTLSESELADLREKQERWNRSPRQEIKPRANLRRLMPAVSLAALVLGARH